MKRRNKYYVIPFTDGKKKVLNIIKQKCMMDVFSSRVMSITNILAVYWNVTYGKQPFLVCSASTLGSVLFHSASDPSASWKVKLVPNFAANMKSKDPDQELEEKKYLLSLQTHFTSCSPYCCNINKISEKWIWHVQV